MPQFKPRVRKHKVLRRMAQQGHDGSSAVDSNPTEIIPGAEQERKLRREALSKSIRYQQPNMSSKKRRRLDKYIDTKLRREENVELLKKLANAETPSGLESSKNLGVKRHSRLRATNQDSQSESNGSSSEDDFSSADDQPLTIFTAEKVPQRSQLLREDKSNPGELLPRGITTLGVGGGLKRPLEVNEDGNPVIKKRVRATKLVPIELEKEEIAWEGFLSSVSSSDSASVQGSDVESDSDSSGTYDSDIDPDSSNIGPRNYKNLFSITTTPQQDQSSRETKLLPSRPGFKEWATQQINQAKDFTPTPAIHFPEPSVYDAQSRPPRLPEIDPLPLELQIPTGAQDRASFAVPVNRSDRIQEARLKLPVVKEEARIMEAIHNNPVVVLAGATGSGKTTQIPQFLYEAGYGNTHSHTSGLIGITQPRRVSAVTMARRVSEELGGQHVAYQIRFESNLDKNKGVPMKFMTDGILLREIAQDFALLKYSAIIIDEAHERSFNTDILIGMASRIVELRAAMNKPLKLIIMSATLMVDAFMQNLRLFPKGAPPLLQIEGRQFPISNHWARTTRGNYVLEGFKKITRGHERLPPGAMLVFLTGQDEILALKKRLVAHFSGSRDQRVDHRVAVSAAELPLETEDLEIGPEELFDGDLSDAESSGSEDDVDEFNVNVEDSQPGSAHALVLPLYSQLPTKDQLRVFEPPPDNTRLIILATNVAETSITIPGVRYVFDSGRVKERKFNEATGVQSFEIGWISKASAAQRAGRAGRTGPGHCYRLYSSAVYERDFADHSEPEILKMPIDGIVLQLKSLALDTVINFPFPTPPDRKAIAHSEKTLSYIGALDSKGKATPLGRELSIYPVSPRYAKMLLIGHRYDSTYLTTALVAAFSIHDLFVPESSLGTDNQLDREDEPGTIITPSVSDERKKAFNKAQFLLIQHDSQADALKFLSAVGVYASAVKANNVEDICNRMFIKPKAMKETFQLYQQLIRFIHANKPGSLDPHKIELSKPSKTQVTTLKQIVASVFLDQVAIRADLSPNPPETTRKPRRAIEVPYYTLFPSHNDARGSLDDKAVYIHPSSALARMAPKDLPKFLVYSHLQTSTAPDATTSKTRMHPLTPVSDAQLFHFAQGTALLEYGKPIGKVENVPGEHDKRIVWSVPSMRGEPGGQAWPLPAVKLVQIRDKKGDWQIDKVMK